MGPIGSDPDRPFVPLQSPLAVHSVASVLRQRSEVLRPARTAVAAAVKVTAGAAATDTRTVSLADPPVPRQLSVNVLFPRV